MILTHSNIVRKNDEGGHHHGTVIRKRIICSE